MIHIDNQVPAPAVSARLPRGHYSDTLAQMNVGDSIVLPAGGEISFRAIAHRRGYKITGRKQEDGSSRFWVLVKP